MDDSQKVSQRHVDDLGPFCNKYFPSLNMHRATCVTLARCLQRVVHSTVLHAKLQVERLNVASFGEIAAHVVEITVPLISKHGTASLARTESLLIDAIAQASGVADEKLVCIQVARRALSELALVARALNVASSATAHERDPCHETARAIKNDLELDGFELDCVVESVMYCASHMSHITRVTAAPLLFNGVACWARSSNVDDAQASVYELCAGWLSTLHQEFASKMVEQESSIESAAALLVLMQSEHALTRKLTALVQQSFLALSTSSLVQECQQDVNIQDVALARLERIRDGARSSRVTMPMVHDVLSLRGKEMPVPILLLLLADMQLYISKTRQTTLMIRDMTAKSVDAVSSGIDTEVKDLANQVSLLTATVAQMASTLDQLAATVVSVPHNYSAARPAAASANTGGARQESLASFGGSVHRQPPSSSPATRRKGGWLMESDGYQY